MNEELVDILRRREASTSVGPSTARRMGPKGTVHAARVFLAGLELEKFVKKTEKEFQIVLDQTTQKFVNHLPKKAKYWGAARKFLNIFLRGAVYNRYLCEHYKLFPIERWLELPLDSHVAQGLRKKMGGKTLPKWETVIGLDSKTNRQYQVFAANVAKRKKTHRVHLDVLYWRHEFVAAKKPFSRIRRLTPRRREEIGTFYFSRGLLSSALAQKADSRP